MKTKVESFQQSYCMRNSWRQKWKAFSRVTVWEIHEDKSGKLSAELLYEKFIISEAFWQTTGTADIQYRLWPTVRCSYVHQCITSLSSDTPFLLRDIFFWRAAARTALPLSCISGPPGGDAGREREFPPPSFFGVPVPPAWVGPSRRGNWTFLVSNRSSVTHSSNRLLTENWQWPAMETNVRQIIQFRGISFLHNLNYVST